MQENIITIRSIKDKEELKMMLDWTAEEDWNWSQYDFYSEEIAKGITIRPIENEGELEMMLGWAAAEGWNPGKDHKFYFDMDNKGYVLIFADEKPIGCIAAVRYPDKFSHIGIFIVVPDYRRLGLGDRLFKSAIHYLGDRAIGLCSVPQQIPRYASYGFEEEYPIERFYRESPPKLENKSSFFSHPHSRSKKWFEQVCEYDRTVFKHDRRKLLRSMLDNPNIFGVVCHKKNEVIGYGLVRPCLKGFRIGPIFADNAESAKSLGERLFDLIPGGEPVILDIPRPNPDAANANDHSKFIAYFDLRPAPEANTTAMIKKGKISEEMSENLPDPRMHVRGSLEIGG